MTQTLLVTGGAGFIGANYVHHRLGRHDGARIVTLDALTYAGTEDNLHHLPDPARHTFVAGDICDRELVERLLREHRVDTIVHFAAESHVDRSISGPAAFVQTNLIGTFTLLEAARQYWLAERALGDTPVRFHHVSTDEVFGSLGPTDPAFTETTPYDPRSPYSASKAGSDHLVQAWWHTYGLPMTISNCSNNYGPLQNDEKLIPLLIGNVLKGAPIPIYGDGQNIRDWLYVEDHCRGIDLVLARGRVGETYNIGGINEWKNIDIARLICGLIDQRFATDPALAARYPDAPPARGQKTETLISFVTDRAGHDRRYAIDPAKSARELGYRPAETFESGIARTLDWYLARQVGQSQHPATW